LLEVHSSVVNLSYLLSSFSLCPALDCDELMSTVNVQWSCPVESVMTKFVSSGSGTAVASAERKRQHLTQSMTSLHHHYRHHHHHRHHCKTVWVSCVYRAMCMRSADCLSQDVFVSVCLSVCHMSVLCQHCWCIIKLFSPSGSHTILVFPYLTLWQYSNGDPTDGRRMQEVWKNRDFWPVTHLALSWKWYKIRRYSCSCYGRPIGTRCDLSNGAIKQILDHFFTSLAIAEQWF